jgi:sugar O-acyltransferase (sialic acid O-acetyltransferase NeuD family)
MSLPVIILGGGGHAKVLIEALKISNITILGITDSDPAKHNTLVMGIPVLGDDDAVTHHLPGNIRLVNGMGSVTVPRAKTALFERFKSQGYVFITVIHPSAVIASDVTLGEGAQIMAGAVIQPGSTIGMNTIVNTKASVDHDCHIGKHVHISPGVTLSGDVRIGDEVHIGTGATVIQGIRIGRSSLIGAGSVVVTDVPENTQYAGVPARQHITKIS